MAGNNEIYERYGNEEEAKNCSREQKLLPRPNHETQPKWIADIGKVLPRTLGKSKNYKYRIEIVTKRGTKEWLKQFEIKSNEPGRYAIPSDEVPKFNNEYVISVSTFKRGAKR